MNRLWTTAISAATLALLAACGGSDDDPVGTSTGATPTASARLLSTDFTQGADGWVGETSDYTTGTAPTEVVFEQRETDSLNLGYAKPSKAQFISGRNNSDDAFLYMKKQLPGFLANTSYTVTYTVNLLSNAPSGCMGVGGAPGESVWLVAGGSATEPKAVNDGTNIKFNLDKGNQAAAGATSVILGNLANGRACEGERAYTAKVYRNVVSPAIKADAEGKLWIYLGIDSGFEATSSIYLQSVTMIFTPVTPPTT